MANGIMQLRQSDTDELRITKINQNFLALLNSLGKGFSGFSLDNNNTGYYNALINRLEYDNVYADRFGAYIASADYLNVGTAWFNSATFQQAIAQYLEVDTVAARLLSAEVVTAGTVETSFVNALVVNADYSDLAKADIELLRNQVLQGDGGWFQFINADWIKVGTLSFDRLIGLDPEGHQRYARWVYNEETEAYELRFDQVVNADILEDNSVEINKMSGENFEGDGGFINFQTGRFAFWNEKGANQKNILSWDGNKLVVALDSALISFTGGENQGTIDDLATTLAGLPEKEDIYDDGMQTIDTHAGYISDLQETNTSIQSWMKFEQDSITLSRFSGGNNVSQLKLTSSAVTISAAGNEQSRMDANGFYADQGSFKNIKVGDWVLQERSNNRHLSLKYIGTVGS